MSLEGKVVAIAGAAGGLGPTVARAFASAGARLAVAGRRETALAQLLDALPLPVDRRMVTAVDLTDPDAARSWADRVAGRFGRVDVVLHLVGGYRGGTSMAEAPTADWAFLRSLLIETTFNVTRAFAAPLKANGRGRFLSVSSPLAQSPAHLHAAYASAKAAADALVLALADELRGSGSTANIIVVSGIITPEMRAADPAAHVGRSALAEEIAAAMLYLCTDEAGAINGARLPLTR